MGSNPGGMSTSGSQGVHNWRRTTVTLLVGMVLILLDGVGAATVAPEEPSPPDSPHPPQMHFVPYVLDESGSFIRPETTKGCVVRLAPDSSLDQDLRFPCGLPFTAPPGKYRVWVEGLEFISAVQNILHMKGQLVTSPSREHRVGVVPAGRLAMDPDTGLCEDCSLRAVHLTTNQRWGNLSHEFGRRADGDEAREGVLLPAGFAVGAVFDRSEGEYRAFSRPVSVRQGETTLVSPSPPEDGSDVFVVVERPHLVTTVEEDDVTLVLRGQIGQPRFPDVTIPTTQRILAIWYGVQGHYTTLEARSSSVTLVPQDLPLAAKGVTTYRGQLLDRPDLEVSISLPESLRDRPHKLRVLRDADRSVVRENDLKPGTTLTTVEDLPSEPLHAVLDAAPWTFLEAVDLSVGEDATVAFAPTPLHVSGRVFHGEEGCSAELSFAKGRGPELAEVSTDNEGSYEVDLFVPGTYGVTVTVGDSAANPMLELVQVTSDMDLDFHVPDNSFRVRVQDAETAEGLAQAEVLFSNSWGGQRASLRFVTGEDGIVRLPPVRPGVLMLAANADGYLQSQLVERVVSEDDEGSTIKIALEKEQEDAKVVVRLPGGAPAARAEAVIVPALTGNPPRLWQGMAGEDGTLVLPVVDGQGFLLIRHLGAGFAVIELPGGWGSQDQVQVTLPVPGPPFVVNVVHPDGRPVSAAQIYIWGDGVGRWLSGGPLTWLTWGFHSGTDGGFWQGKGVPAGAVQVAAWVAADREPENQSVLQAAAVTVPFPWPSPVHLEVPE